MADKAKDDESTIRRIESERPEANTAVPEFDAIIEAILGADPAAIQEHQKVRRDRKSQKP